VPQVTSERDQAAVSPQEQPVPSPQTQSAPVAREQRAPSLQEHSAPGLGEQAGPVTPEPPPPVAQHEAHLRQLLFEIALEIVTAQTPEDVVDVIGRLDHRIDSVAALLNVRTGPPVQGSSADAPSLQP
jgi:hypothetical protein